MASSRTSDRGRVLGRAKPSASPVSSTSSLPSAQLPGFTNSRLNDLQLPSESFTSSASLGSTPKTLIRDHDISSIVAAGEGTLNAAPSVSSRLVCPICNEEMVTLLQLNRHLDDAHRNLEVTQQDEVKNWFKTQMVKAKKFQPLVVINQKLKGIDVFESNEDTKMSLLPQVTVQSTTDQLAPVTLPRPNDAVEAVTREHWQRITTNGRCFNPICDRRLGGANGNINCRKCGKLFCEEDTMYQMKLSNTAQHEPIRGVWCRVCETCYKSRIGYNDHNGMQRDHMTYFASMRQKALDASYLEVTRLEKRITKLTLLLSNRALQEDQSVMSYFKSFSGSPSQKRLVEQSVVQWEDDMTVPQCPLCHQGFTNYSFRRHHCRLCGRVICADPITACSTQINLDVASRKTDMKHFQNLTDSELELNTTVGKRATGDTIIVRVCKDCYRVVFNRSDFARDVARETPDDRAFQNLKQFENGIRTMLPRFQRLLLALQDPDRPPTQVQLADATKVRKRVTDSFTQYSVAAIRIRDLPSTSAMQTRLQQNVYAQATTFLHIHMLPLKSLPKILKHASPTPPAPSDRPETPLGDLERGRLAAIRSTIGFLSVDDGSSAISSLEYEEKELREKLIVLEEQKFMVGKMLVDAQRRRKFEEVESLGSNLEDLSKEISTLHNQLGSIDFASVYVGVA